MTQTNKGIKMFLIKYKLYATNLATAEEAYLGFIPEGINYLNNIVLADGRYRIDLKVDGRLWENCRTVRSAFITIGGGLPSVVLPDIKNLVSETQDVRSRLVWSVNPDFESGFNFGIWFSSTSSIDISDTPDVTISYCHGQAEYSYIRRQTEGQYVAVAAYKESERGIPSEIYQPWDTIPPDSPENQYAATEES
jgi:hypothetical protein